MKQLAMVPDTDSIAEEFAILARQEGGAGPAGFVFDREEAHERKSIAR